MILVVVNLSDYCLESSHCSLFPHHHLLLNPPHPILHCYPLLSPSHRAQTLPTLQCHLQQIGSISIYFNYFMFTFALNFHALMLIIAFTIKLIYRVIASGDY